MPEAVIRPCQPSDLESIRQITVESFGPVSIDKRIEEMFGVLGNDWKIRKLADIDCDVERESTGILVAADAQRVVGYVSVNLDAESLLGRIVNLAVRAEFRGQGWGKRLIREALDYCRSHGMTHVKIETVAHNDVGTRLYPAMGFREVCRQVHYVQEL